ncbi:glycosyltransferase, partial [Hymenobacter agri]
MPVSQPPQFVILLASVLKPVDDTRMRGKFAETLAARPGMRVHVAGRAAGEAAAQSAKISLHPIFNGRRLSLGRLAAQWRYGRLLHGLKPDLVIVHAPELLPLTLLWQALGRGRKFIYDIRENYALNVSTQQVYQGLVRGGLAAGLRWVEALAARR